MQRNSVWPTFETGKKCSAGDVFVSTSNRFVYVLLCETERAGVWKILRIFFAKEAGEHRSLELSEIIFPMLGRRVIR